MTLIKIEQNDNGSHDNQTIYGVTPETFPVPEGWAVIPEELGTPETLENYPFGEITIAYNPDGTPMVTSWTPLPIPELEPGPEEGEQYTDSDMILALMGYERRNGNNENR